MSRRTVSAKTTIPRVGSPHPWRWAGLGALLGLTSGALALWSPESVSDYPDWVSPSSVGPAKAFVIGALVLLTCWCARRALFARLARRPGPLETVVFVNTAGDGTTKDPVRAAAVKFARGATALNGRKSAGGPPRDGVESPSPPGDHDPLVVDVMWHFRRALSDLKLSPTSPLPGGSPQQSFLEVMRTAVNDARTPVGALAGALAGIVPNHAYRVSGVLKMRAGPEPYGISVQVSVLPADAGAIDTVWEDTWIKAAQSAAHFVGSFVLPRTRLCATPPWTGWQGLALPASVFGSHQRCKALIREARYEEAMDSIYEALDRDPKNPYLRIELGQLQELLGMHLDALATYADVIAIESWEDRRLWQRIDREIWRGDDDRDLRQRIRRRFARSAEPAVDHGKPPPWLKISRNGPDALMLARYRLIVQFAAGRRQARQWQTDNAGSPAADSHFGGRRDRERIVQRARLKRWVRMRYRSFVTDCGGPSILPEKFGDLFLPATGSQERPADEADDPGTLTEALLALYFQYLAVEEGERLIRDYRWLAGRRRPGMPVTQRSLKMMRIWAPLQLFAAERRIKQLFSEPVRLETASIRRARATVGEELNWPPPLKEVRRRLKHIVRGRRRSVWQEEYNAACALAVGLLDTADLDESVHPRVREITAESVAHLERAVGSTSSGHAALRYQWISAEDQDLNWLRRTGDFREFLDRYFPASEGHYPRPTELRNLLLSNHMVSIAQQYARLRAHQWRSRPAARRSVMVNGELRDDEGRARRLLFDYAHNVRHWQTRLEMIRESKALAGRLGVAIDCAVIPQYAEDPAASKIATLAAASLPASEPSTPDEQNAVDEVCREITKIRDAVWPHLALLLHEPGLLLDGPGGPPDDGDCLRLWEAVDRYLTDARNGERDRTRTAYRQLEHSIKAPRIRAEGKGAHASGSGTRPRTDRRTPSYASAQSASGRRRAATGNHRRH